MLIKEVFDEFLKTQKQNLTEKTYRQYKDIIELFEECLHSYAWNSLEDGDEAYEQAEEKNLTFAEIYDHTYIWDNVGEFLDYFIPKKVNWGDEFVLKTCPRVIRKLLKWMREEKLLNKTNEEIKIQCENQTWEDTLEELEF
jgi:hypothetical protein